MSRPHLPSSIDKAGSLPDVERPTFGFRELRLTDISIDLRDAAGYGCVYSIGDSVADLVSVVMLCLRPGSDEDWFAAVPPVAYLEREFEDRDQFLCAIASELIQMLVQDIPDNIGRMLNYDLARSRRRLQAYSEKLTG